MESEDKIIISACIVVYKEEDNIGGLLDNIKDFVDEIVLVYDGEVAEDRTLEIAEDFCREKQISLKIFKCPHVGEAEILRPFSFRQATGNWILWIDGDERIVGSPRELKTFIKDHPKISYIRFVLGTSKELKYHHAKRRASLFKKDSIYYFGIPHQKVGLLKGDRCDYPDTIEILHLEKRRQFGQLIKRSFKWSKIYAKTFFEPIQKIEKFNTNEEVEKDFERNRNKKINYAIFYMLFSSPRAVWLTLVKRRDIGISLSVGLFVFMSYFYISIGRLKRILIKFS